MLFRDVMVGVLDLGPLSPSSYLWSFFSISSVKGGKTGVNLEIEPKKCYI